jgi:hypothetical protein
MSTAAERIKAGLTTYAEEVEKLSGEPSCPYWLQDVLDAAAHRDALDRASCLRVVADLADAEVKRLLGK